MARLFITLARRHGAESPEVVALPGVPFETQLRDFKALVAQAKGNEHPEFAEVQLWASDQGMTKKHKFKPTAAAPAPDADDDQEEQEEEPDSANSKDSTAEAKNGRPRKSTPKK